MNKFVGSESTAVAKGLSAQLTNIRSFTRMDAPVVLKIAWKTERPVTYVADVRSMPGMYAQMLL